MLVYNTLTVLVLFDSLDAAHFEVVSPLEEEEEEDDSNVEAENVLAAASKVVSKPPFHMRVVFDRQEAGWQEGGEGRCATGGRVEDVDHTGERGALRDAAVTD